MYLLRDMFIEEFKEPIDCIDNFINAVKLCKLCTFDALSVSCYLDDDYQFYRYINVNGLFIYFFISKRLPHLYVTLSSGSSLKSLQEYLIHDDSTVENLKTNILAVLNALGDSKLITYCIGHSAAGSYAYYLAHELSLKAITIGQLPMSFNSYIIPNKSNVALFTIKGDLLCIQPPSNIIQIKTTPAKTTLEGVVNHSIDSYISVINDQQDLEVKLDYLCH